MITALIAREMGTEIFSEWSASAIFRSIADAVPAYGELRYPSLKDESNPVQVKHAISAGADLSVEINRLKLALETMPDEGSKNNDTPRIGHKLHRLTTMTSKTPQFHLLAHGNPKPENLLVSPLVQFELDGTPRKEGIAEAAAVGAADRSAPAKII
jgi:hypothetical protein